MTKEAIFGGLSLIRKEIDVMQRNLALKDSSSVAFRLRNVVDHVVVGNHMYSTVKGLSCDLSINVPHDILNATSKAARWRAVKSWSNKLADKLLGENGQYKLVEQVQEALGGMRELAARGLRESEVRYALSELELRRSVFASSREKLKKAVADFKELIKETIEGVDEEIKCRKQEAEAILEKIEQDRARMVSLFIAEDIEKDGARTPTLSVTEHVSATERALSWGRHFEEVLELASYAALKIVPYGDISYVGGADLVKEDSSPELPDYANEAKAKLGIKAESALKHVFYHYFRPDQVNSSSQLNTAEAQPGKMEASGCITGLENFRQQLKALRDFSEKWMDPDADSVLRERYLANEDLSSDHLSNEISAYETIEKPLSAFMEFVSEANLNSEKAEQALELAKEERYERLALSEMEFNARMEDLNEQKTLLLRILSFLVEFNKQIARINIA